MKAGWDLDIWGRLPKLGISELANPFLAKLEFTDPTEQYIYECSLLACGAQDPEELEERLAEAAKIAAARLFEARTAGVLPVINGACFNATRDVGLTYCLLGADSANGYPTHELYGSLALWLMLKASHAYGQGRCDAADAMVLQASICLGHSFAEGGRVVVAAEEKERRRSNAVLAAASGRQAQKKRKEALFAEFDSGNWADKGIATSVLAPKYHFSPLTVRKWLQGR